MAHNSYRDLERSSKPRVDFAENVSQIDGRPLTSVREGDASEVDERIVDAYMAARSIAGYGSESDYQ